MQYGRRYLDEPRRSMGKSKDDTEPDPEVEPGLVAGLEGQENNPRKEPTATQGCINGRPALQIFN